MSKPTSAAGKRKMKDEQTSTETASDAARLMRHEDPRVRKVAASALNQAPNKKRYIAVRGINFEGLKGRPRIEPGQRIPDTATQDDIEALLAVGAIAEAK